MQTSEPQKNSNDPHRRKKESRTPAIYALRESCVTLSELCDVLLEQLEKELPQVKQDRIEIDLYREQYEVEEEGEENDYGDDAGDEEMEEDIHDEEYY